MVCGPSIPALGFLQQAVLAHEQGKLELSLHFLKHARESDPVLPLPVFLEGIYLRHGWGCRPDHPESYRCLHIALMLSIDALKATIKFGMGANAPPGLPTPSGARSMVGLVLYEMSASHRFGWGVRKDRGLANQLMELAANLGDVDACVDVGTRSLKHNEKRKAARYLRWASFGGWKDFGTGWIWKVCFLFFFPCTGSNNTHF
ncbi:hypothetical protein BC828DRAFT_351071 [Blastocladiella britannica]|nr:hypothetical protein BC828DRAFT_351071 [Blastocladiella britannica]